MADYCSKIFLPTNYHSNGYECTTTREIITCRLDIGNHKNVNIIDYLIGEIEENDHLTFHITIIPLSTRKKQKVTFIIGGWDLLYIDNAAHENFKMVFNYQMNQVMESLNGKNSIYKCN